MKYGIMDLQDKVWIGENDEGTGPKTFDDPQLAEIARLVAVRRLGWSYSRLKVREMPETTFKKKDEVPTIMSTERALKKLEEGL